MAEPQLVLRVTLLLPPELEQITAPERARLERRLQELTRLGVEHALLLMRERAPPPRLPALELVEIL